MRLSPLPRPLRWLCCWPFLLAGCGGELPVAPVPTISPVSGSPSARVTLPPVEIGVPGSDAAEAQAALAATNAARAAAGLAPLSLDAPLSAVAKQRSDDMLARQYFAHVDPDGRDPFYHIKQAGIAYRRAAENIATGPRMDGAGAVDGWLHSEGHRRNILTAGFKRVGFGRAVASSGKVIWAQLFTD